MRTIDADALICDIADVMCNNSQHITASSVLKIINSAPTVGGWISVKDRFPNEDSFVLVCNKEGSVFEDWFKFGAWQAYAGLPEITHWMPLPKPPKEANMDD